MNTEPQIVDSVEIDSTNKRPTFLTVLCLITFVVSGYNLIMSIVGLFTSQTFDSGQMEEATRQLQDAMAGADPEMRTYLINALDAMQAMMQTGIDHALTLSLAEIVAASLSILGAFWMFKLRKKGFYTYIIAKIIGVAVPLAIFGFNILTGALYGFVALMGIVFIILYSINRKALN